MVAEVLCDRFERERELSLLVAVLLHRKQLAAKKQ